MKNNKQLIIFVAHLDDVELSCLSYIFKNHTIYKSIKIFVASYWEPKDKIWQKNLKKIKLRCKGTEIEYINLQHKQRTLMSNLDFVKDIFYKKIDFGKNKRYDILTHSIEDCHTDHVAVGYISKGILKYTDRYVLIHSPSVSNFDPNYWVSLSVDDYLIKKDMCDNYTITKEQSYTKVGHYLQSEKHYNIGRAYQMENFVHLDDEYSECYKILKWRQ